MSERTDAVAARREALRAEIGAVRETLERLPGPAPEPLFSEEIARRAREGAARPGPKRLPAAGALEGPGGGAPDFLSSSLSSSLSKYPLDSLVEARRQVRSGAVSPAELAREALERAQRESGLNAFLALPEAVSVAAGAAETLLAGLPVSVKDLFEVAGWETTSGSGFPPVRATASAPAWEHLAAHGATLLGKTNLHEWAFGVTGNNPHFGPVRNPHDPERIVGGSSSGSAASLAAGIGYGSLGSDTGGSIRIPAALAGIFGFKPSFGRISCRGVTPLSRSLDHVGPMARSAADLAVLWAALSGEKSSGPGAEDADPGESPAGGSPTGGPPASGPLSGWVVGIPENHFYDDLTPEARQAAGRVVRAAEDLGAVTRPVRIPEIEAASVCRTVIAFAEAAAFHRARLEARPGDFGADVRTLLRVGAALDPEEVRTALRGRRLVTDAVSRAFGECDLLIVPTTPAGAPRVSATRLDTGEEVRSGLMRLVGPFDLTGHPALSVPAGRDANRMPLGAQLVGPLGADASVLGAAQVLEAAGQRSEAAGRAADITGPGGAPGGGLPPPGCYIPPDAAGREAGPDRRDREPPVVRLGHRAGGGA